MQLCFLLCQFLVTGLEAFYHWSSQERLFALPVQTLTSGLTSPHLTCSSNASERFLILCTALDTSTRYSGPPSPPTLPLVCPVPCGPESGYWRGRVSPGSGRGSRWGTSLEAWGSWDKGPAVLPPPELGVVAAREAWKPRGAPEFSPSYDFVTNSPILNPIVHETPGVLPVSSPVECIHTLSHYLLPPTCPKSLAH